MPTRPEAYVSLIRAFAAHFSNCIWQHARVLLLGAILADRCCARTSALRFQQVPGDVYPKHLLIGGRAGFEPASCA
jgi:hypothetical protein